MKSKMKVRKSAAKRYHVTGSDKIMRESQKEITKIITNPRHRKEDSMSAKKFPKVTKKGQEELLAFDQRRCELCALKEV
jgi:hypothetical protein